MSAIPLPPGNNAAEMIRRLRAIDAEIFGTLYANAGIIGGDVEIQGDLIANDIYSESWDGTVPLALPDGGATEGYALDSSLGIGQFKKLYATGEFITDLVAAEITVGQITDSQVSDIATTTLTGVITTAQIDALAVTQEKVALNAIDTAQIAADAITAGQLADLAVDTEHIQALAINAAKIDALAVTTAKIDTDAITTAKIAPGAVDTTELAADAVTAGQLADLAVDTEHLQLLAVNAGIIDSLAVTTAKLDTDAVTTAKIAVGAVDTTELATDAVTAAKIEALAVGTTELALDAVTASQLADNAVDTEHVVALAIGTAEIQADAVTNTKIGPLAVDTTELATDAVTGAKIENLAVDTEHIQLLAVGTAEIQADAVTNAKIGPLAVDTTELATDAVTNVKIGALAVDTAELAADAVESTKIADLAVGGEHIQALSITAAKIAAGTITANEILAGTITGVEIAAITIAASHIVAKTIEAAQIKAGTITAGEIAAGTITANEILAGTITANEMTIATLSAITANMGDITAGTISAADIYSSNWLSGGGTVPIDLTTVDTGATTGFALDGATGNVQVMGDLFFGEDLKITDQKIEFGTDGDTFMNWTNSYISINAPYVKMGNPGARVTAQQITNQIVLDFGTNTGSTRDELGGVKFTDLQSYHEWNRGPPTYDDVSMAGAIRAYDPTFVRWISDEYVVGVEDFYSSFNTAWIDGMTYNDADEPSRFGWAATAFRSKMDMHYHIETQVGSEGFEPVMNTFINDAAYHGLNTVYGDFDAVTDSTSRFEIRDAYTRVVTTLKVGAKQVIAPWTGGTVQLGELGSVGTMGSFTVSLDSNWMRTTGGYVGLGANGQVGAAGVEVTPSGVINLRTAASLGGNVPPIRAYINDTAFVFNNASRHFSGVRTAPGIAFSANAATGIWLRSGAQLAFTSNSVDNLWIVSDGMYVRTAASTGSAANVFFNGSNRMEKSTSARKYKKHIESASKYLADIDLEPVKFWRDDDEAWSYGFIADDLGDQDELLGVYATDDDDIGGEEGEIENYHTNAVMAILASKIIRLEKLVQELSR